MCTPLRGFTFVFWCLRKKNEIIFDYIFFMLYICSVLVKLIIHYHSLFIMKKRKYRFTNLNNFIGRRLIFYIATNPSKPHFYRWLDSVLKNEDFSPPALFTLYCILLKFDYTLANLLDYLDVGVATKQIKFDESRYFSFVCKNFFKLMRDYESSK